MEGAGKLFIMASLFYLVVGPAMGLVMAYKRGKWVLRLMPSHGHINLLGWISMMIFGFSYSFLPMMAGKELYSQALPYIHFSLWNLGLVGMASVWFGSRFPKSPIKPTLVWPFGLMLYISIWLYVINIGMTIFS